MAAIVPRWEWRMFGRPPKAAEAALAAIPSTGIQETDERYFLIPGGDTVKFRADLMDVKVLRETDADGLERWEPILKVGFPLARGDVLRVFESFHVAPPPLSRDAYDLDAFMTELTEPAGVRSVVVRKRRDRFELEGCTGERTVIEADGRTTQTVAVESPDAAAVVRARARLGLDGFVNTSYPKGLQALLDDEPDRFAVIDTGTNSIKFHIAEIDDAGEWHPVVDRAEMTRLGEGIDATGVIGAEPLERAISALAGMAAEATEHHVRALVAVGTAGLRLAGNRDGVLAAIRERTGVRIEVISGEDESRLAYQAVTAWIGLEDEPVVVFDTGGGSTQFTFGRGTLVDERFSVNVGAVRITERFGLASAVSSGVVDEARAAIAEDFARIAGRPAPDALIGMGGAVTNMAAVKHGLAVYDPDIVQGTVLDRAELDRQIELYRSRDAEARRSIVGLQPKRAEVILAGACVVRTVMELLGQESFTVSDRGLRHGVLLERFGR